MHRWKHNRSGNVWISFIERIMQFTTITRITITIVLSVIVTGLVSWAALGLKSVFNSLHLLEHCLTHLVNWTVTWRRLRGWPGTLDGTTKIISVAPLTFTTATTSLPSTWRMPRASVTQPVSRCRLVVVSRPAATFNDTSGRWYSRRRIGDDRFSTRFWSRLCASVSVAIAEGWW